MTYKSYMELNKGQIIAHIAVSLGWNIFNLNQDQIKCVKKWSKSKKNELANMAAVAYNCPDTDLKLLQFYFDKFCKEVKNED